MAVSGPGRRRENLLDLRPSTLIQPCPGVQRRCHDRLAPDFAIGIRGLSRGQLIFEPRGAVKLYGASARCVAIGTATDRREEFPAFREFWLAAPRPGSNVLVLYGLLDSPSLTAAFEFDLRPGSPTRITVTGELFARREVRKLAIATRGPRTFRSGDARVVLDEWLRRSARLAMRASGRWGTGHG